MSDYHFVLIKAEIKSAGLMPWISRDLNQWPVAIPGEGLMDVVIQSIVSSSFGS